MSQLISEGYANKPYTIDDVKCNRCEAVANYVESDILIDIGERNNGVLYRVNCKGGCNRAVVVGKSLPIPIIVHDRIINKIDRLLISCKTCRIYIKQATKGEFEVITEYLIFDKEVISYKFPCGHTFYLDKTSYPIITNYLVKQLIFNSDST